MISTPTIVERLKLRNDWPLKRKVAWFVLYLAIFFWAGVIILPQGNGLGAPPSPPGNHAH